MREEPPAPSSVNPQVTPALDSIVLKAMAKGPANRYQSAAEMRADLVRVLSGQRPSAPAVMTAEDRTSIMGNGSARTQVVGRHRPAPAEEESSYDPYDAEAEEAEERRRRRKKALTIGGVVVACIAVLALAAWLTTQLLGGGGGSTANSLPDVTKMKQTVATSTLHDAGWTNVVSETVACSTPVNGGQAACGTDDIGKVIKQDPAAGSATDKGAKITLTIGAAPQAKPVPDVSGKSQADATKILNEAGFNVNPNTGTEATDNPALVGNVSSTNPAAGTSATPSTQITLLLGKAPESQTVPDVRNQTYEAASANLTQAGFKVSKQTISSTQPAGIVVKQNPDGGSKQKPNTTITLFVSQGDQFTMINIAGKTKSEAQQALQALGWKGNFSTTEVNTTDPTQVGKISDFDPSVGSSVSQNSSINIRVYKFGLGTTTSSSNN